MLLFSCFIPFFLKSNKQLYSFSLIQILLNLPILAGVYFYCARHMVPQNLPLLLFSENIFALIWLYAAHRISRSIITTVQESRFSFFIQICAGTIALLAAVYSFFYHSVSRESINILLFDNYGIVYFCTLFLLLSILSAAWNMEKLWWALTPARRWEYKFLLIGFSLICGSIVWSTSYRLTYERFISTHFTLLAILILIAWSFILYAIVRHRLLNRKIFISRKIVYSFVAPSIFAVYFCLLGIIFLIMKNFGFSLPFILRLLFLILGIIIIGILISSRELRRRAHFFISTHFYVNKYEYRDEWLTLSRQLKDASTEDAVIFALRQVLAESLYTADFFIWLGDAKLGYKPVFPYTCSIKTDSLEPDDVLIRFLNTHSRFYLKENEQEKKWEEVAEKKKLFFNRLNLILMIPLFVGDQLVGMIGLGPEFTGGHYGRDDFDLLSAICTQTASAILVVRTADKLARARERLAWDKLSAFVLHDVKNAATILSLVRENAREHIQNPEFQQDMLAAVDDALKRMDKVQERLSMIKGEREPVYRNFELGQFLNKSCQQISAQLGRIKNEVKCETKIKLYTDPNFLFRILENLLLNAFEAAGDRTTIKIDAIKDIDSNQTIIKIRDNGPGFADNMLPDMLFEPFASTKAKGTGIGLWQVKQIVTDLNGTISAENPPEGGAGFIIKLPLPADGRNINSLTRTSRNF